MVRLAFFIHFNRTWLGGVNVMLNLINSLAKNKDILTKIKIVIITNSKKDLKKFSLNKYIEIREDKNFFNRSIFCKVLDKILLILTGKTHYLEKFLIQNKINFVSHTDIATGINSVSKSIVWIPDFQFIHLKNLFSLKYKFFRRLNIFLYKKHAYKILLSSKSAYNDLKKIINIPKKKIIINSFSFVLPASNSLRSFSYLKKKYNLKKNFFYLPNQYWVHKNHFVVLKALYNLKLKNNGIKILSTGFNYDYRRPEYFKNILKFVKENGLEKNFYYLGVLPYQHSLSLIKNSVAVINPSLFEGWSSTVEQSKSIGKKIILSNINVHKEQNPKNCHYFNPKNHLELSKIMKRVWNERKLEKEANLKKYQNIAKIKFKNYSKDYCKIVFDLYEKNKDI